MGELTKAHVRALQAVKDGKVRRTYRQQGNVLKAAGHSSAVLWELSGMGAFRDAPGNGTYRCPQVLTPKGIALLSQAGPAS